MDSEPINLTHHFLIAMPGLSDESFAKSVVYLCEHSDRGALGLVINKPSDINVRGLFDKVDLPLHREDLNQTPVYHGGPVHTERGFVLHEPDTELAYSSSISIPGGLTMTTSKDVLEAVAQGRGPKKFMLTLGYAGWSAGQLEEEIALNGWINVPLPRESMVDIIFDTPSGERYQRTMKSLGFDLSHLSGEAGHA